MGTFIHSLVLVRVTVAIKLMKINLKYFIIIVLKVVVCTHIIVKLTDDFVLELELNKIPEQNTHSFLLFGIISDDFGL